MSRAAVRGRRRPPVERIRDELRAAAGGDLAAQLPTGYQRLGHVLVVRWPESLRPHFPLLADAFRRALGIRTILRHVGPIEGELRTPRVEVLLEGPTETEVVENGIHWRFDAARIMFAAGNRTERARAGRLVRPGETVVDLFAGIGYFALPAAVVGRAARVVAVDRNPLSVHYLEENARRNGVADRVEGFLGDNRSVALPPIAADRVFLGYLPSALPWVGRAVPLLRLAGGWLHVHTVVDARGARTVAEAAVARAATEAGGTLDGPAQAREVKPYGPGRTHVVVDA
ncbi:MAG TPA: 50S ribosomal protein L11 methyltransferase, partial [Thermoplasmata archaeon]|nr:50S ribosomal protein L11 methyltransferase [Thermoplasmata archaeon]